jgi:hypothetical protein
MASIAIPSDVLRIFAACEAVYADASRKGYAKSPDVVAAVGNLKSAYRALVIANFNLTTSKGPFGKTVATLRVYRACRVVRKACLQLQTTLEQVSAEDRLYSRCLVLFGSNSNPKIDLGERLAATVSYDEAS